MTILRIGICRLLAAGKPKLVAEVTFTRSISGKSLRGETCKPKKAPFDYKNKSYTFLRALFDRTTHRFDENSKVIVVEGPVAAGKTKFAQDLACELEMLHIPEATMDMTYVNPYGYDMRQLDPQLPVEARSCDVKKFCENPNDRNVAAFQIQMYQNRFSQYIDALAHVFNTGQGVVLERSPYSDYVFTETMLKHNYISKAAKNVYYDIRQNTIGDLLRPHLIIYLDVPVKIIQERIKKRNIPYEVNSKLFTQSYLENLEHNYKQKYLKEMSEHCELLIYDWSDYGDSEVVVEDIERINFDNIDKTQLKLRDWNLPTEWDWADARATFTNDKWYLMSLFNVPHFEVPELVLNPFDAEALRQAWYNAPGMKYRYGYNKEMGDKNILFKTKLNHRDGI